MITAISSFQTTNLQQNKTNFKGVANAATDLPKTVAKAADSLTLPPATDTYFSTKLGCVVSNEDPVGQMIVRFIDNVGSSLPF